ncbi:putative phosphatase like proteins to the carbon terminal domain of histone macroH2A1, partial [Pyronema omphalodes]
MPRILRFRHAHPSSASSPPYCLTSSHPNTKSNTMSSPMPLPIDLYANEIHLWSPAELPARSSGEATEDSLDKALNFLYTETGREVPRACSHQHHSSWLDHFQMFQKLSLFNQLLTVRPPSPPLPDDINGYINDVFAYLSPRKPLTSSTDIPTVLECIPENSRSQSHDPVLGKVSVWKGDITRLCNVTSIVNAANSRLLGCFRPDHPCIDNAIHAAAGPQLRKDCEKLIELQGFEEPTGEVKVTRGYFLPSEFVLHTVGPIVERGSMVTELQREQLGNCYKRCMEATEVLPTKSENGLVIAFCCISTGMFGYPANQAVDVAVSTVQSYFSQNPNSKIQKVIFNVFTPKDFDLYTQHFSALTKYPELSLRQPPPPFPPALTKAAEMIREADALLITAGAGLSASYGLDYTSKDLFSTHFPGMATRGISCLYEIIGHKFASAMDQWGYFFSHISTICNWPLKASSVYDDLLSLTFRFDHDKYFVRTSNADGLFSRHGFDPERISTPQGDYRFIQCVANCRPDAVFPSDTFLQQARAHLDVEQQIMHSEEGVPLCPYCGGDMFLCVRADGTFNDYPFQGGNRRYQQFLNNIKGEGQKLVVLEIGSGWNTPGVIRWPNEALVEDDGAKLVRIGMKGSEEVPWEFTGDAEGNGVQAVGINGDAEWILKELLRLVSKP